MGNHYIHDDEDRHSLTDKILMGIAVLGTAGMFAQFAGCFEQAKPKMDRKAVASGNMVYEDFDGDGDVDSAVWSKGPNNRVLREIKYDNSGNPYIVVEHPIAFEVDPSKPYKEQKQAALNGGR